MTVIFDQPMHPTGHTLRDAEAFEAADLDPADSQSREWVAVTCYVCGASTRHVSATCDAHYQPPARARRYSSAHMNSPHTEHVGA